MPTSTKELESLVIKAQEATRSLDDDLRGIAFERVLNHLLGSCTSPDAVAPIRQASPGETDAVAEVADSVLGGEQQRIDALARYFKMSPDKVKLIFDVSEEQPGIVLESKRLAKPKAHGTQEITLLVTGARTALGLPTTTTEIRKVADNYDRLDSSNFTAALGKMPGVSVLGKPGSQNRIVRMKVTGAEAAQALAQRIVG